jgi:hypothetical protein
MLLKLINRYVLIHRIVGQGRSLGLFHLQDRLKAGAALLLAFSALKGTNADGKECGNQGRGQQVDPEQAENMIRAEVFLSNAKPKEIHKLFSLSKRTFNYGNIRVPEYFSATTFELRLASLEGAEHFLHKQADGDFTVVCSNSDLNPHLHACPHLGCNYMSVKELTDIHSLGCPYSETQLYPVDMRVHGPSYPSTSSSSTTTAKPVGPAMHPFRAILWIAPIKDETPIKLEPEEVD